MSEPKNQKLDRTTWLVWIFFLFLLHPTLLYIIPYSGLDNSWNIAINWAFIKGLTFGIDFVFTYGPLGFLGGTYLTLGVSKWVYFAYNLVLWALMGFVLYKVLAELQSLYSYVYIFLSILLLQLFFDRFFLCLYLQIFLSALFLQQKIKGWPWLFLLTILSVYLFFSKLNIGLIAYALHLVFICYLWLRQKIKLLSFGLLLVASVALLSTLMVLLLVDPRGYLLGSLHIISAYNDCMYLPFKANKLLDIIIAYGLFFSFVFILIKQALNWLRNKNPSMDVDTLFILGCLGGFFYILIKQGFTRFDDPHEYIFFAFLSLLAGGFYFFTKHTDLEKRARTYCTIAIVLASSFYVINNIQSFLQNTIRLDFIVGHSLRVLDYWDKVISPQEPFSFNNWPIETELPASVVNRIGDKTIDIVPHELSIAFRYNLNFSPRPVIQSYKAYDAYLDQLNSQHYASDEGPAFILFRVEAIDDRYPFFDESQTKLAILQHYQVDTVANNYLLFSRRDTPKKLTSIRQDTLQIKLGDTISLASNEAIQWAEVKTHYHCLGRILRFFLQPPDLKVEITYQDESKQTFRACKTILEGGVMLNKAIPGDNFALKAADIQVSRRFFDSMGKIAPPVKQIRFFSNQSFGFQSQITVYNTYYSVQ